MQKGKSQLRRVKGVGRRHAAQPAQRARL